MTIHDEQINYFCDVNKIIIFIHINSRSDLSSSPTCRVNLPSIINRIKAAAAVKGQNRYKCKIENKKCLICSKDNNQQSSRLNS